MKAFVSYSLDNSEKYLLSLLSMRLNDQDISTISSYSNDISPLSLSANQIRSCQFFIGIMTHKGLNKKKVLDEWKIARNSKIPALLLVEDKVKIRNSAKQEVKAPNIIKFNRVKAEHAIEIVNTRIRNASVKMAQNKASNDTAAWLLGGTTLLLLLGLLGSEGSKK